MFFIFGSSGFIGRRLKNRLVQKFGNNNIILGTPGTSGLTDVQNVTSIELIALFDFDEILIDVFCN